MKQAFQSPTPLLPVTRARERENTMLRCLHRAAQGAVPAGRQAREKHECQIRWARRDQSGCVWAAEHWAPGALVPASAVQACVTPRRHVMGSREDFKIHWLLCFIFFILLFFLTVLPFYPRFWKRRVTGPGFGLSHVAMNRVDERKCVSWLGPEKDCSLHMTHLISCAEICREESARRPSHLRDWCLRGEQIVSEQSCPPPPTPTPHFFLWFHLDPEPGEFWPIDLVP